MDVRQFESAFSYPAIDEKELHSDIILNSALNDIPNKKFVDVLLSVVDFNISMIENYDDYELLIKTRHDVIHALICDFFLIPFGERTVEELFKDTNVVNHEYFRLVRTQTPDFLGVINGRWTILEVAVSTSKSTRERKAARYALLFKILQDYGYNPVYKIFCYDPIDLDSTRYEHVKINGLTDGIEDKLTKICSTASIILSEINSTTMGQIYYYRFFKITKPEKDVDITIDDVLSSHDEFPNKCFHSRNDLQELLSKSGEEGLTMDDKQFINQMFFEVKSMTPEIGFVEEFNPQEFQDTMSKLSTSKKRRSIFPLPYFKSSVIDSSMRSTEDDWASISYIASKMKHCNNAAMSVIGASCWDHMRTIAKIDDKKNSNLLFACKLPEEVKYQIALEGPGRKYYLKKGSVEHTEIEKKWNRYSLDIYTDVDDVEDVSFDFSKRDVIHDTGFMEEDMKKIMDMNCVGLNYVRVCQSIYREININSMRSDRRKKYLIKPTGVKGVFILLYPGTKLRCGELANIVWFKIIAEVDEQDMSDHLHESWIFKKKIIDKDLCFSKWLSCDVHRLDHYIRCFDKIIMSYSSIVCHRYRLKYKQDETREESEPREVSLISQINGDNTNLLGLIILTYMEDRRSTSKMLQNVRYLVMTSISIFPKIKSTMEKFKDPIRSSLQLYFLQKCLHYIQRISQWRFKDNVKMGTVKFDERTQMFLDTFGGSILTFPRPLVTGGSGYAEFNEILAEMYFTMLFNKNQDDPTHSSFQVLDKIIEGEDSFQKVKKEGNHLGYRLDMSDIMFAKNIVRNPKTHQFSKRAIEIGSKLLREKLGDPNGDHYVIASNKSNLNKTLDEFATFKSSSTLQETKFHPSKKTQNKRRKCLEGINDLLTEGLCDSFDVASKYKREQTFYHVFKKNQIGGVREILILPITNRIRINILESFSRNICSLDKREVLTHGRTKNESIRSVLYASKKYPGMRLPIHITLDKSKWGPTFVPIQFIYMFTAFRHKMGNLFNLFLDILIRHQNKDCVLPDRLVKAWSMDMSNKHKHDFIGLQNLKESFMENGSLLYKNESNMGQGILHYTSSFLHLCLITFRDHLYKLWCKEQKMSSDDHEDLLSSDDSYTIFCPELKNRSSDHAKTKLMMFLKCQQISEYLFNCRTSKVKSSINPLIGEFNSLFISNMSFIPTLFKYCLSSVHPINTDSFFRMVKEGYSASRQIVENGGGLDLYYLSSLLNKKYCEEIYHTYPGGANDFSRKGLHVIPYHMGNYPLFDPAMMVIFGPEYYNYNIYNSRWNDLTSREKLFYKNSHKIIEGSVVETSAEYEDGDTILAGFLRIEVQIGPVGRLNEMKKTALMTRDELRAKIIEDPMIIIRKPRTIDDIRFRVTQKLYTNGSKEAVKNIAASIYYGRVSASVSANVFYIPGTQIVNMTFSNCVDKLLEETPPNNFEDHFLFLYPKHQDYDTFKGQIRESTVYRIRNPLEIQTVQTLSTHKIYTKLFYPVPDLLEYKWNIKDVPENIGHKVERDFFLLQQHFPQIKSSLEQTKESFSGQEEDKVKGLLMLMLKMHSLRDRTFKGVIYGNGSGDLVTTYTTLSEKNFSNSVKAEISLDYTKIRYPISFDKIYCAHNHTILNSFATTKAKSNLWDTVTRDELALFFMDHEVNLSVKKKVFICALANGLVIDAEDWSGKVKMIMHRWITSQSKKTGKWEGNLNLLLFMGPHKMIVTYDEDEGKYYVRKQNIDDFSMLYDFFKEAASLCDIELDKMIESMDPGKWSLVSKEKMIVRIDKGGFNIIEGAIIDPIYFKDCKLDIDDMFVTLLDSRGTQIYRTDTGLLRCSYQIDKIYDLKVFNMWFSQILKMNAFSPNFNLQNMARDISITCLSDLVVDKPKISNRTKSRLRWTADWDEKKDESLTMEDDTLDVDDDYEALINEEPERSFVTSMMSFEQKASNDFNDITELLVHANLTLTFQQAETINIARQVFLQVKNLKYDIICHHTTYNMFVNKRYFNSIRGQLNDVGNNTKMIIWSLVSLYDRTYTTDTIEKETDVKAFISKELDSKFKVSMVFGDEDFEDYV